MKKIEKHNLYLMGGALVVLAAIGLYAHYKRKKRNESYAFGGCTTTAAVGGGGRFACLHVDTLFPLRFGSCGDNVKALQRHLNTKGGMLTVDGKFGPMTQSASVRLLGDSTVSATTFKEFSHA